MNSSSLAADAPPPLSAPQQLERKAVPRWRWWIHLVLIGAYPLLMAVLSLGRMRLETWRELEVFLGPGEAAPAYAGVAAKLGQTENAIAAAVRRMRDEFRTLLRQEVADTLASGEAVDEELRYLLRLAW